MKHYTEHGWYEVTGREPSPEPVRVIEGPGGAPLITNKTDEELQGEINRELALSSIKEALEREGITWVEYEVLDE